MSDNLRDELEAVARDHFAVFQSETGPIRGCRCGGLRLGQSYPQHVTEALLPVIARHMRAARADELEHMAGALEREGIQARGHVALIVRPGKFASMYALRNRAATIRTEQKDQT